MLVIACRVRWLIFYTGLTIRQRPDSEGRALGNS